MYWLFQVILPTQFVENMTFPASSVDYAAVEVSYETDYYGSATQRTIRDHVLATRVRWQHDTQAGF